MQAELRQQRLVAAPAAVGSIGGNDTHSYTFGVGGNLQTRGQSPYQQVQSEWDQPQRPPFPEPAPDRTSPHERSLGSSCSGEAEKAAISTAAPAAAQANAKPASAVSLHPRRVRAPGMDSSPTDSSPKVARCIMTSHMDESSTCYLCHAGGPWRGRCIGGGKGILERLPLQHIRAQKLSSAMRCGQSWEISFPLCDYMPGARSYAYILYYVTISGSSLKRLTAREEAAPAALGVHLHSCLRGR